MDATAKQGPLPPILAWFGYDEPNYTYTANGRKLLGELAALSPVRAQYTYDPTHLYTGGIDPRGNRSPSTTYDTSGRLHTVTDALGQTTSYDYAVPNLKTTVTYPDIETRGRTSRKAPSVIVHDSASACYNRARCQPCFELGEKRILIPNSVPESRAPVSTRDLACPFSIS